MVFEETLLSGVCIFLLALSHTLIDSLPDDLTNEQREYLRKRILLEFDATESMIEDFATELDRNQVYEPSLN